MESLEADVIKAVIRTCDELSQSDHSICQGLLAVTATQSGQDQAALCIISHNKASHTGHERFFISFHLRGFNLSYKYLEILIVLGQNSRVKVFQISIKNKNFSF